MEEPEEQMKEEKGIMRIFAEGAAGVYVILMLAFFPLYYQNNYIDISTAKLNFFRICSIGLAVLLAVFAGFGLLSQYKEDMQLKARMQNRNKGGHLPGKEEERKTFRQRIAKISVPAWFTIIFVAGVCIATIFSVNPLESWLGKEGRKLGLMVWLLCVMTYVILGKYFKPGKWTVWTFIAGNAIVFILAILNFWSIDPLGMYENLALEQAGGFISTIGNVNACASYMCMVIPAGMAAYWFMKNKLLRNALGVFLALGFWTCYCTVSESWLLGIGAAFLVLLWFAISDHYHMQRFLEICGLFWIGSVLMKITVFAGESIGSRKHMFLSFVSGVLQNRIMLSGYVLAIEGILIAGVMLFIRNRQKKQKELPYRAIRKWIFGVLAVLAGIGILLLIIANLRQESWEGSLAFLNRLQIQDSFGSTRGYIWKTTMKSWAKMPLWDKVTGYGLNCYHMFIQQYGGSEVSEVFNGALLIDAHNEFMQFLTTTGLLGVVGYFGLLISTAVRSARQSLNKPQMILGIAVICAYIAQGMVNNPTIFLTPYLFLMLGIIKGVENLEDVSK